MIGYLDPDGTATVSALDYRLSKPLAPARGWTNWRGRAKRAGHPGRIGPLRANIYLGLLDGHWQHHIREQIIADLVTCAGTGDSGDPPAGSGIEPDTAQPAQRVGVEVRVGLSTLLGRDQHLGEIPGWGTILAEIAHTMVVAQRYAITDSAGQLLLAGIKRVSYITVDGACAVKPSNKL